jgi:hypothetical protein
MKVRLFFTALLIAGAGCGGVSFSDACKQNEQCVGGNDADVQACEDEANLQQELAANIGCKSEFKALYDCILPLSTCHSEPTGQSCKASADCKGNHQTCTGGKCLNNSYGPDQAAQKQCEAEQNAYNRCK